MNPEKTDVYSVITDRIIEKLKQGIVPWKKPWRTNGVEPTNMVSGKAYRGVNVFLLGCSGFPSPYWVSYKQASELGGQVRKGEKSTPAVFWKIMKESPGTPEEKTIPLLRYYSVFNVSQCDGLEAKIPQPVETLRHEPIKESVGIVDGMPLRPSIVDASRAAYRQSDDIVMMPQLGVFSTPEDYYATLFHELIHSTMHASRLNRREPKGTHHFGSSNYAKEELIAEMGANFLGERCGIQAKTEDNSASYIANWLHALNDDKKLVVMAAAKAQKAAEFILGIAQPERI
jgi:antirestriction protein ArdC